MTLSELLDKTSQHCVYLYDKKLNVADWFEHEELTKEQLDSVVIDWSINHKGYLHADI